MLLFTKGGRGRVDKKEEIRIVKKAIKGKPDAYGQLISEYQKYLYRVAFLYIKNEKLEIHLQNRIKSNAKSILFFSIFVVISFFLGRFSMDLSTALYIEPIPCAIFFVAGCCLSYVLCSSKYADARKAQKDSYDKSINDQKEISSFSQYSSKNRLIISPFL